MKENTTKDIDVYSKDSTVIERPESYNIGVKVGWTAPAKWWNWLFKNVTERLKDIFVTTTSIHNEIKNAVGGTLDPESDSQLKDKLEQMKKDLEGMTAQVQANLAALEATKAQPNGIASLDPDGRIPYSQLPESAMEFKGDWDASTNTPTLADGTGDLGDMYLVSVGGTVDLGSGSITFLDGDRVIYNQSNVWEKISGGSVKSVNTVKPDNAGNVNVVVDTEHIASGAVTSDKIASGAVTRDKIADDAVTEDKLSSMSVTADKLSSMSVTADKIADDAVTADKIADNAIATITSSSGLVMSSKLADNSVYAQHISDGAVTANKFSNKSVTAAKIADNAVTANKIADGAVTKKKVAVNSNIYLHYVKLVASASSKSITLYFTIICNKAESILNFKDILSSLVSTTAGARIPCTGDVVDSKHCPVHAINSVSYSSSISVQYIKDGSLASVSITSANSIYSEVVNIIL